LSFTSGATARAWRCELQDYGDTVGVVAQFYCNDQVDCARHFEQSMSVVWTPREMAIAWAHEYRQMIQRA
jgi:hypothetical protein